MNRRNNSVTLNRRLTITKSWKLFRLDLSLSSPPEGSLEIKVEVFISK